MKNPNIIHYLKRLSVIAIKEMKEFLGIMVAALDDFYILPITTTHPNPLESIRVIIVLVFFFFSFLVYNLPVQLKYISCFVPENVMHSIYGYYLTTLQASIAHIMQGGLEEGGDLFKSIMRKTTDHFLLE